ncbi:hypothetical protein ACVIHH_002213 [Bradyrhizobium sp. USDA 4518]|nr:hypothetical protein [Bradyrhizobium sp. USDA 4545]MCP1851944.1 hypothetical protein [Bradyrhizobium sp. USDA 4541]MCP1915832.1 hypothetical protein [Bradyrhizobium elkanii]MCP1917805.1 hypothetical protein [Bradyrhizobium sp. USDA 4532]
MQNFRCTQQRWPVVMGPCFRRDDTEVEGAGSAYNSVPRRITAATPK